MNYNTKLNLFVTIFIFMALTPHHSETIEAALLQNLGKTIIGFLIFCLLCGVLNTIRTWYKRRVTPLFEGPALLQRDPDGEPVCLHCGWPLSSTPPGITCIPSIHAEEP